MNCAVCGKEFKDGETEVIINSENDFISCCEKCLDKKIKSLCEDREPFSVNFFEVEVEKEHEETSTQEEIDEMIYDEHVDNLVDAHILGEI